MPDSILQPENSINPSEPVLPLDAVVNSLRSSMPDVEWMLAEIESQHGWFRFPPLIANSIENLKIQSYPLLYTNEGAIAGAFLKGFLDDDEIRELNAEFEAASFDERGEFLDILTTSVGDAIDQIEIPKAPAEQEAARKKFLSLSPDEQKEAIRVGQHFYMFFLSSFFQSLGTMVHGEKLTSLVTQAMSGNDEAFVKAVQIDRRILTEIPYFKDRFARSHIEGNQNFSDLISYRLGVAPYRGKIRHKALWYTFSVLDQSGLLNTTRASPNNASVFLIFSSSQFPDLVSLPLRGSMKKMADCETTTGHIGHVARTLMKDARRGLNR